MPLAQQALFDTVSRTDPLEFWSNNGCDFRKVSDFLDFDNNELSKLDGISKKSVRLDERIPADLQDRLEQIANIITLVAEYFHGDPRKTALWFKTPNPLLGEISPRDMIRYGRYKRLMKFISAARQANSGSVSQN
jgi:hypothetical protein